MSLRDFGPFLAGLRDLRQEEKALGTILARAGRDQSASEPVVRDHRLALDRVRAQIKQKQSAASGVLDALVAQINELRLKALEVRGNIEELRDHAELGGADPKLAEFSAELQRTYGDIFDDISRREIDLRDLHEELRELDEPNQEGAVPAPTRQPTLDVLDAPASISDPLHVRAPTSKTHDPRRLPGRSTPPGVVAAPRSPTDRGPLKPPPLSARLQKPLKGAAPAVPRTAKPARPASRDRKIEPRYPYQAPVRVRIDGRSLLARSGDISKSGMFLEGRPTLSVGTAVTLGLAFRDFPLEIAGEVVYETPGVGMGVRFTSSSAVDARMLDALLDHLRKLAAGSRDAAPSRGGSRGDRRSRPRAAR